MLRPLTALISLLLCAEVQAQTVDVKAYRSCLDSMGLYRLEKPQHTIKWAVEAEIRYKKLQLNRPRELARIYVAQAEAYHQIRNWDKSREYAKNALQLGPSPLDQMRAFNLVGEYHKAMLLPNSARSAHFQSALEHYDKASQAVPASLRPDSQAYYRAAFLNNRAECFLLTNQIDTAEQLLDSCKILLAQGNAASQPPPFVKLIRRLEGYINWNRARIELGRQQMVYASHFLLESMQIRWEQRHDFTEEWREADKLLEALIRASAKLGPYNFNESTKIVKLFYDWGKQYVTDPVELQRYCFEKADLINSIVTDLDEAQIEKEARDANIHVVNTVVLSLIALLLAGLLGVYIYYLLKRWRLLNENERLLFAFKHATPAISIFDDQDKLRFFNASFQKYLGRSERQLQGMQFAEISQPETITAAAIKQKISENQGSPFQYDSKLGNRYVRTEAIMFPENSPLNGWWVAVDTDVTDLRNIAWIIGHEMKGHLRPIAQLARMVSQRMPAIRKDAVAHTAFQQLINGLENAYVEFESLDSLAKYQLHEEQFHPQACSLKAVLDDALDKIAYWAEHNFIEIKNETKPGDVVLADEQMLYLVFRNLLNNSINAIIKTKKGPESPGLIRIWSERDARNITVNIQDNGCGIPANLFDILFSGDKRKGGLGTQLCRHFITLHGGRIFINESRPGHTVITFTLPVAPEKT